MIQLTARKGSRNCGVKGLRVVEGPGPGRGSRGKNQVLKTSFESVQRMRGGLRARVRVQIRLNANVDSRGSRSECIHTFQRVRVSIATSPPKGSYVSDVSFFLGEGTVVAVEPWSGG